MPGAVAIHSHCEHWDYWEPSLTSVSASTWDLGASPASSQPQQLSSPRYTKVSQSIVILLIILGETKYKDHHLII